MIHMCLRCPTCSSYMNPYTSYILGSTTICYVCPTCGMQVERSDTPESYNSDRTTLVPKNR